MIRATRVYTHAPYWNSTTFLVRINYVRLRSPLAYKISYVMYTRYIFRPRESSTLKFNILRIVDKIKSLKIIFCYYLLSI